MLRKFSSIEPLVKNCHIIRTMTSVKEKECNRVTAKHFADENMTKRSKKKLRRYMHQQRLEKKNVSAEELKQLPNYCAENVNETDYYHQNGLRKVYPYYYNFNTYVKGRWMGRTILDVFTKEFHSNSAEYYKYNIEIGRVTVNGENVTPEFILGNNQLLEHTCHRHENPIKHTNLEILVDDDDVLVVNKPSSWPIHPCGRYRYNSLTHILQKEYGYKNLRGLYRLDRLTSGVFILAKTAEFAAKVMKDIADRNVQKEYVARVVGHFPDGRVECREPLSCISFKLSIYRTDPKGKESYTTFERLSYNGKTSVVKCMPHTGRTHQIRVHLQFLGNPIVNDNMYNSIAFGPSKGKGGLPEDTDTAKLEAEILKHHNVGLFTEPHEHPVFLRKQAAAKDRNLDLPDNQKSECLKETVTTLDSNNLNVLGQDTSKSELEGISNTHSSSAEENNPETVGRENFDFTEMKEENLDTVSEPAQKRIKVDNACDLDESASVTDETSKTATGNLECNSVEKVNISFDANVQGTSVYNTKEVDVANETYADEVADKTVQRTDNMGFGATDSSGKEKTVPVKDKPAGLVIEDYNEDKMYDLIDLCCQECRTVYVDPKEEDLVMYLHAYRYKGSDWEYGTPLPDWAQEDWQDS